MSSDDFRPLSSDNVVSVQGIGWSWLNHKTFTVGEIMESIKETMGIRSSEDKRIGWIDQGIECRVLQPNSGGWQTGRVRIYAEFCPDPLQTKQDELEVIYNSKSTEAESPLDEIRQMMNDGTIDEQS